MGKFFMEKILYKGNFHGENFVKGKFSWGIFDWKDFIILFLIMLYPMFSPKKNSELIQVDFMVVRRCHRGEHRGEQKI